MKRAVSNALVRMGVGYETDAAGFQLGLQVRSIDYTLEQEDHVQNIARDQTENWLEWTPTWGGVLKFQEVQVRYAGFVTTGTGRVGVFSPPPAAVGAFTTEDNFLIAPDGPLTLQEASVITHQLTVSLPIH